MDTSLLPEFWATAILLAVAALCFTMLRSLARESAHEPSLVIGIRLAGLVLLLVIGGAIALVWMLACANA